MAENNPHVSGGSKGDTEDVKVVILSNQILEEFSFNSSLN